MPLGHFLVYEGSRGAGEAWESQGFGIQSRKNHRAGTWEILALPGLICNRI